MRIGLDDLSNRQCRICHTRYAMTLMILSDRGAWRDAYGGLTSMLLMKG